jgi:hypothetical protein
MLARQIQRKEQDMKPAKHIFISVAVSAALVALLASPATARVVNSSSDSAAPQSNEIPAIVFKTHPVNSSPADTPLVKTIEVSDSSGFDLGSASIGAATVLGAGVLMSGAVLFNRRRHRPVAHKTAAV